MKQLTKWQAEDGTEFNSVRECREYEIGMKESFKRGYKAYPDPDKESPHKEFSNLWHEYNKGWNQAYDDAHDEVLYAQSNGGCRC